MPTRGGRRQSSSWSLSSDAPAEGPSSDSPCPPTTTASWNWPRTTAYAWPGRVARGDSWPTPSGDDHDDRAGGDRTQRDTRPKASRKGGRATTTITATMTCADGTGAPVPDEVARRHCVDGVVVASAAWRHVVELMSRCCARWERTIVHAVTMTTAVRRTTMIAMVVRRRRPEKSSLRTRWRTGR